MPERPKTPQVNHPLVVTGIVDAQVPKGVQTLLQNGVAASTMPDPEDSLLTRSSCSGLGRQY